MNTFINRNRSGSVAINSMVLVAGLSILCLGCSPKTVRSVLPIDLPDAFSERGVEDMADKWWTVFNDELLNELVDSSLANNFDILSAWHRLQASHAMLERQSSLKLPIIDASLQSGIRRDRSEFVASESLQLGLSSVYEVDLWGRLRSIVDAESFRTQATEADFQTAAITISGEIVLAYYQLAEAKNQLQLLDRQIETNQVVLRLLESRFGSGQISRADILRQRQLLESTIEQSTYIESRNRIFENQLSVLSGRIPRAGNIDARDSLPVLPPLPDTGIPLELVERRPDVRSTYYHLMAADKDLATAISNQYPRFSLRGSVSTEADQPSNLFKNWVLSLAGNLVAPIFYGGELKAEVRRNESIKEQRLYEYAQTVLLAIQEVEDALVLERNQLASINSIEEQLVLARQTIEQLRTEYFNGVTDYLDVITSLDQEQELQRDLLSAKMSLIGYRIALYRALAGGISF